MCSYIVPEPKRQIHVRANVLDKNKKPSETSTKISIRLFYIKKLSSNGKNCAEGAKHLPAFSFLSLSPACFASAAQSEKKEGGKELIKTDEDTAAASLFLLLLLLSFLSLLKTNSACDEGGGLPFSFLFLHKINTPARRRRQRRCCGFTDSARIGRQEMPLL